MKSKVLMQLVKSSLVFIPVLLLLSACTMNSLAQQETDLPEELGTALGIFKINGPKEMAKDFENFDFFRLKKFSGQDVDNPKVNSDGMVAIDGWLQTIDGKVFKFKQAALRKLPNGEYEDIEFTTRNINGTSFRFKGRFLRSKVFDKNGFGYTSIRGVFIRVANGKRIISGELPFYAHAIL